MRQWLRRIRRRLRPANTVELTETTIVINLYITQSLILIIGMCIIFFQSQTLTDALKFGEATDFVWSAIFCAAVIVLNVALTPLVPEKDRLHDEMTSKLARRVPLWHLLIICLVVGFCEEILFRGALQYWLGPYWTSILFALIHVHYLKHWVLTGMVFLISYGLGLMYELTGNLWSAIVAHACYDFIMFIFVRYDIGGNHERKKS